MADISLGTFEVTQLQMMPIIGPQPQTQTASAQMSMVNPPTGLTPLVMLQNMPEKGAGTFAFNQVTLGTQYEVILREVVHARTK